MNNEQWVFCLGCGGRRGPGSLGQSAGRFALSLFLYLHQYLYLCKTSLLNGRTVCLCVYVPSLVRRGGRGPSMVLRPIVVYRGVSWCRVNCIDVF